MTQISFIGLALAMVLSVLSYTQAAPTISLEKRHDTEADALGLNPILPSNPLLGHSHSDPNGQNPAEQGLTGQNPTQQGSTPP